MADLIVLEMALALARGDRVMDMDDIRILAERLDIYSLRPEALPGRGTISGKPSERKAEIFRLAQNLWRIEPEGWLAMEKTWLQSARLRSGGKETDGKDNLDDVVSAELLIRILATVHFISTAEDLDSRLAKEALFALNLVLGEAIAKGRTRTNRKDGKSHYSLLKNAGIMIGTGGGKYLPGPERSLPMLFILLNRQMINSTEYN